jgi:hypothetical protein
MLRPIGVLVDSPRQPQAIEQPGVSADFLFIVDAGSTG